MVYELFCTLGEVRMLWFGGKLFSAIGSLPCPFCLSFLNVA